MKKIFEDGNRPGDKYIVDADCVEMFVEHMAAEGAAMHIVRFVEASDDLCRVHKDNTSWCGMRFDRQ